MSATTPPAEPFLAIFDHDGVLVDSLELHQTAWLEMGRRTGLPITAEFIHETFGMTNPMILARLLGDASAGHDLKAYADEKEACYREIAREQIELMDGVHDLIENLRASGFRLAIGSSGPRPNLELTVDTCGLNGRFAAIAALEDIRHGKPDPEVFLLAAGRAGIDPARAVVFEDAPVGVRAAKAAGMYAVAVTSTHTADALWAAGADEVVDTLAGYDVAPLAGRLARSSRAG